MRWQIAVYTTFRMYRIIHTSANNMKQIFRSSRVILLTLAFVSTIPSVQAQLYVADNLTGDSIFVREAVLSNGVYKPIDPAVYTEIPNGETVKVVGVTTSEYSAETNRPVIEYSGKLYVAGPDGLKFSADNPSDIKNVVQSSWQEMEHTALGHFFYTPFPFILVFIFTAFGGICLLIAYRQFKKQKDCRQLMRLIPVGLLLASVVELFSLIYAGGDATWWCDPDSVGYGKSILYAFPVMVGIGLQIVVGVYYKRLFEDMTRTILSWKSVFIGVGISIPLALIAIIILAVNDLKDGTMQDIVFVSLFLTALAVGFLFSLWKNKKQLGLKVGMLFTSFSFIYAIGVIFAAVLLAFIVFKLLIAMLVYLVAFVGAIVGLGMAFGGSGSSGGGGAVWQNPDGSWTSGNGRNWNTMSEAQRNSNNK